MVARILLPRCIVCQKISCFLSTSSVLLSLAFSFHFSSQGVAALLLKHGAAANVTTVAGFTPLHFAAMGGHYYTLAVLLQHGASKSARDNNGDTALHWAAKGGPADLVTTTREKRES